MHPRKKMTEFNYREYSLSQLENWVHDCMSAGEVSAQEIYDTVRKVAEENYYLYKQRTSEAYELLARLNGNGVGHITNKSLSCDTDNQSEECKKAWADFWEENYYPEEYKNLTYAQAIAAGWEMTGDGFWVPPQEEKINKWIVPVEVDGASGEYFLTLPDDLLDSLGWKEGDTLEYVNNCDGTFKVRKITKLIGMDEC